MTATPPTPDYIYAPLLDNIDQVFTAVDSGGYDTDGDGINDVYTPNVKAGFIGKSQICNGAGSIKTGYVAVEFTATAYTNTLLTQTFAITRNTSGNPASPSNPNAQSLYSYIQNQITGGNWADFLADNCYQWQ
jgi:hypothetical protein